MRYYPKLTEQGSITRPIPEPVRQWAMYDETGRFIGECKATTAQANAFRVYAPGCTIEPINPTAPNEH